ncbi:MAG: hypothetical protein L0154_25185 [Chloroflexi bacterium]|nr:hypothetical protein [Chloroflexota bacterium]
MPTLDDVLNDIFDGKTPALYAEVDGWMRESRRFKAFVLDHHTKIRAKLRSARDADSMKEVRAELATAALLLREKRFTLEYEKYAAAKQRGPDFTVMFKTHTPFNVEVRHIHSVESDEPAARTDKLIAVVCEKVGQMPPSIVNLLWLVDEREIAEADLIQTVTTLRNLAERKEEDFFTLRRFDNAAHFLKQFRQLSGIVLRQSGANVVWLNTLARHQTPPDIVKAIQRL